MAKRYDNIMNTIRDCKPKKICEIGTYSGSRAIKMILLGLKFRDSISYTGYDLFENASEETDKKEYNGKTERQTLKSVKNKITKRVSSKKPKDKDFRVKLVAGNTNVTLKEKEYDFVYIDGGHSIETIRNDYSKVKKSKVIIFDDYYDSDDKEELERLIKNFGCNQLIDELKEDPSLEVSIMPLFDGSMKKIATKQVLVIRK